MQKDKAKVDDRMSKALKKKDEERENLEPLEKEQERLDQEVKEAQEAKTAFVAEQEQAKKVASKKDGVLADIEKQRLIIEKYEKKLKDFEHPLVYQTALGEEESSPGVPVISGPFTNWHPEKMVPIEDFCLRIDDSQPDFIGRMIFDQKCRKGVGSERDMTEEELRLYTELRDEYKPKYLDEWQAVLEDNAAKANLVNFEYFEHRKEKATAQPVPAELLLESSG